MVVGCDQPRLWQQLTNCSHTPRSVNDLFSSINGTAVADDDDDEEEEEEEEDDDDDDDEDGETEEAADCSARGGGSESAAASAADCSCGRCLRFL